MYESNGFDGDGTLFDECGIPKSGCTILPDTKLADQIISPYLVWETPKVMLFDEIGDELKQCLTNMGWHINSMEIPVKKLVEILKGGI